MRKTKIICTLGPAVDSDEMVKALIVNGMDAARLNFSHGSHPLLCEVSLRTFLIPLKHRDDLTAFLSTNIFITYSVNLTRAFLL